MKRLILITAGVLAFAVPQNHMVTKDPGLKLALAGKYKAALGNFLKRCSNNDGYACGMVGYFYAKGFGTIQKNKTLAIKYYKKGCYLKDADSCTLLGYNAYKRGNKKEAKELLKKGCKLGNKDACKYKDKF